MCIGILLFSTTGPIIETSSEIIFGCYTFNYFEFERHFKESGLIIWNNLWNEVYDFTPGNNNTVLSIGQDNSDYVYLSPPSQSSNNSNRVVTSKSKYIYKLYTMDITHKTLGIHTTDDNTVNDADKVDNNTDSWNVIPHTTGISLLRCIVYVCV